MPKSEDNNVYGGNTIVVVIRISKAGALITANISYLLLYFCLLSLIFFITKY